LDAYLTTLHHILWPELIVIGGGVAKHADSFVHLLDPGCELRIAELGNLAGIVGAALTAEAHVMGMRTG
jgi:polyphosphate glucokinase